MECRYCNSTLSPLRSLIDGEFCCDEHRIAHRDEQLKNAPTWSTPASLSKDDAAAKAPAGEVAVSAEAVEPSSTEEPVYELPSSDYLLPLAFGPNAASVVDSAPARFAENPAEAARPRLPQADLKPVMDPIEIPVAASPVEVSPEERPVEAPVQARMEAEPEATPAPPVPEVQPVAFAETVEAPVQKEASGLDEDAEAEDQPVRLAARSRNPIRQLGLFGHWLTAAWRTATLDLKAIAVLLPVLLAVAFGPSMPKPHVASKATSGAVQALDDHWKLVQQDISKRAAVAVTDDFRAGLDAWDSRSNLTSSWSYDAAGFVRPGPLAILKPTTDMTDYHFEFLGEIDRKAMGCVFRARDLRNYYALKFTEVRSGPLPLVEMVRYAVIDGKEGKHISKPLPLTVRADMLYRVMIDVHGSDFTIMAQGQVVDFFSDKRLKIGGVGFFCDRGEKARLRWVEVSHQYDALGRLCAYLAPYGMDAN